MSGHLVILCLVLCHVFVSGSVSQSERNIISIDSRGTPGTCQRLYFSSLAATMITSLVQGPLRTVGNMQRFYASTREYAKIEAMSVHTTFHEPFRSFHHLKQCLARSSFPSMSRAFQALFTDDILALWCFHNEKTSATPLNPFASILNPSSSISISSGERPSLNANAWYTVGHNPGLFSPNFQKCWFLKMSNNPLYNTLCREHPVNPLDPIGTISTFLPVPGNQASPNPLLNIATLFNRKLDSRAMPFGSFFPFQPNFPLHIQTGVPQCLSDYLNVARNFAGMGTNPYSAASRTAMQDKFLKFLKKIESPKAQDTKFFAELNDCVLELPDKAMGKKIFMLAADDILLLSCLYRNFGEHGIAPLLE